MADIAVYYDGGTIALVTPLSDEAKAWVEDNIRDALWFGRGIAVEPRYLNNLLEGMCGDGLVIE